MPKDGGRSENQEGDMCVEMGFYADISWESECNIEINVWAHFYKISLVFKVPSLPWGQMDARKKLKLSKVGINMVKLVDSVSAFEYMLVFLSTMLVN